ncbi:uncharacterized protein RSE6_08965 [Rhynchosporium secalis]|uniref:HMG box domain-containing protein n=1 Tax=Rhynchosporium secalis TaxID=38038 RepID=A0A1E1MGQ7_RHYSE|nr:uncharacterized protein RSE6_08965 [Rhynchosporium secalis]
MLSSIGRASVRRVVTRSPQSTTRAAQGIWQFQRANIENANNTSNRSQVNNTTRRSYATATKAIAKPKASKPSVTSRVVQKPANSVNKKVVAKKTVKKPAKKLVKKPIKKARKPVAKPAKKPVKRVKKPKSEAQLAAAAALKKTANLKALKAVALQAPDAKPTKPWLLYVSDMIVNREPGQSFGDIIQATANKWKNLSPAELEVYNRRANENKAENAAAYKKWVESHTPDEIRQANLARAALRRLKGNKAKKPSNIKDERQPKRALSAQFFFHRERWASGDLKGIRIPDATALLFKEWNELSPAQKQVYKEREVAAKQAYVEEHRAVFKRDPPHTKIEVK